jgi:hypothetical protein
LAAARRREIRFFATVSEILDGKQSLQVERVAAHLRAVEVEMNEVQLASRALAWNALSSFVALPLPLVDALNS